MLDENFVVSLYTVKTGDGKYFGGYSSALSKAVYVEDPRGAKKFTNKHDIKLRPDESVVELKIDLNNVVVEVSQPFRPHRRKPTDRVHAAPIE